ncbi:MAG: hypothetical protein QG668_655 [Patescibacteria group bacterium]|nr:hypothetical protein [Patescibacteria group bacterium]
MPCECASFTLKGMKSLPSARVWMAAFAALGWFAAAYLLYTYLTGGPIACGPTSGCDVVRASRYAYVGPIPQPLLGLVFYTMMLGLLIYRSVAQVWHQRLFWATRALVIVAFLESIALFLLQWLDIRAFCFWCLLSGAASTGMFVAGWFDRAERTGEGQSRDLRGYAAVMLVLALVGTPLFLALIS